MTYTVKKLPPITADPCAEFFGIRSKIQKLRRQQEKKGNFFKRLIREDGFMSLEIEEGDRNIVLSRSTRTDDDCDWQLSYFFKDEATMHEAYYKEGSSKEGYRRAFKDLIRTLVCTCWDGAKITVLTEN